MASASRFLLAARACEIAELEQLARTCELVALIGRFVHALQRERGISNVFLGSRGARFAAQREQQLAGCVALEQAVRASFDALDTDVQHARNGARLFSRVAGVLHALAGLPALRESIAQLAIAPAAATEAFSRLVGGLLAVIFEAADSATDPQVSRALVALFNYMQGKEFAGQERAHGAAVFAAGRLDAAGHQHWRHLVDSQHACCQVFLEFAHPAAIAADLASQAPEATAELERLRRLGAMLAATGHPPPRDLAEQWYRACTQRIDAMRSVEELLALHLKRVCGERIARAREELRDQQALLQALAHPAASQEPAHYGPHLERSLADLVQEQARRLQAMADELDTVRAALNERKVVERAKGLLMAHRQMREDEAYKALRRMAMNQKRPLVEVAEAVLAMAEVLPGSVRR